MYLISANFFFNKGLLFNFKLIFYLKFQQTQITRSEVIKRMSQKREQKICNLVIWMNIAFLICWMPYGIICICYMFGGPG